MKKHVYMQTERKRRPYTSSKCYNPIYGSGGLHPEVQVKADHIWGIRIKKNDR